MKEISAVKIPVPAFNATVIDALPASVVDKGKIRMGSYSPLFPATPAK